jgi:putative ABC transport system substrate-binding protein
LNRRDLLIFASTAIAWPLAARAQQQAMPVIGCLISESGKEPFRQGLGDLGYVEGKNIRLEFRPLTPAETLPRFATELVELKVNIILVTGSEATRAAQLATRTIPIVMTASSDPVGTGFAATLARPGGNITGLSLFSPELSGKRLELLKEVSAHLSRVVVLWNPNDPPAVLSLKETETAARLLGIELQSVEIRRVEEFDAALMAASATGAQAVDILSSPLMRFNADRLAAWALQQRLPSIFWARGFTTAGGLMSYGPDIDVLYRRSADYVARILHGANPADMPVEQPTKFDLVINLKTAKALDIIVPQVLLAQADEVIE